MGIAEVKVAVDVLQGLNTVLTWVMHNNISDTELIGVFAKAKAEGRPIDQTDFMVARDELIDETDKLRS